MSSISSGSVYFYVPNSVAAITFAALFVASGIFHLWQCFYYKCFKLTFLLPFSCVVFAAGLATRAYGASHDDDAQVYTAGTLLLFMAPPLILLVNIQILGRLFYFVPYFAPMHPARVLATFLSLTFIAELLTVIGVAYLVNTSVRDEFVMMGDSLTKASLAVQILTISVFAILAGIFHHCCRSGRISSPSVVRPLMALYTSMVLILARAIFRIVELSSTPLQTAESIPVHLDPVVSDEWFFYVFDAALMLVNSIMWNVFHPRRFLPENDTVYLAQDGMTRIKGPGWKDTRSFAETFFDPFAALMNRGGHQKMFWQNNGYTLRRRR